MSASTSEMMIGFESEILEHFNLPPITGNRHIDCPLCERKKKFRIHSHGNAVCWICVCGNGGILDLVMQVRGLSFPDAAAAIDKLIGRRYKADKKPVCSKLQTFQQKYDSLDPIRGSMAEEYLNSRGIYEMPRHSVRFSRHEYDREYDRDFCAMYSVISDEANRPCYIHKTYLDGGRKAGVEKNKKLATINASYGSVAIKLCDYDSTLGIAEGIETAQAAAQIYKMPVWATANTAFMKRFKAPVGVEYLIIFADNDCHGAGLAAAFECGHKNVLSNNDVKKVSIRWTDKLGDFCDIISGKSSEIIEWNLTKPIA